MSAEGLGASSVNGSVAAPPRGASLPPAPGTRRARRAGRGDLNLVGRARREPPRGRAVHGSAPSLPSLRPSESGARAPRRARRRAPRGPSGTRRARRRRAPRPPPSGPRGTLEPPAAGDEEPAASAAPRRRATREAQPQSPWPRGGRGGRAAAAHVAGELHGATLGMKSQSMAGLSMGHQRQIRAPGSRSWGATIDSSGVRVG